MVHRKSKKYISAVSANSAVNEKTKPIYAKRVRSQSRDGVIELKAFGHSGNVAFYG